MKPSFGTSVYYDFSLEKVTIQAPHDVRENIWRIIHFRDDGIIDIDGGVPTQIFVIHNPGYQLDTAVGISCAAAYLAASGKTFDELWQMPVDQHFIDYPKFVNLIVPENGNPFSAGKAEFRNGFDYLVQSYLTWSAKNRLENLLNDSFRGLGYHVNVLELWQLEAIEAVGRYNTAPKVQNPSVVIIANPNNLLPVFDKAVTAAEQINDVISGLRNECSHSITSFAQLGEVDHASVLDLYYEIRDLIQEKSQFAREYSGRLDLKEIDEARRTIKLTTPPAPVVVKEK